MLQKKQSNDYIKNNQHDNADTIIFEIINRSILDKNLLLETDIQEITPDDYQRAKDKRSKSLEKEIKQKEDYSIDEGSVILLTEPILSPVKGKPVYEIKILAPHTEQISQLSLNFIIYLFYS